MEARDYEKELEAAYKSLEKADRQIKNLLTERKQLHMTLALLETGGFIKDGKLEEAQGFSTTFNS